MINCFDFYINRDFFTFIVSSFFFLSNTKQTYNNKNGCFIYLFYCFFYSNMAQIFTNNNSCKLKSQSFYKSEPNLVFNLDNKNKILSNNNNNKENCTDVLDYKSYINQQRELLEQIYHQQKKLKQFHFETDYLTSYNATTSIESNNNNTINNNNNINSYSSPKIISPQSRTNSSSIKNNICSNNSHINDIRNEVLLNKQNIMSISLNNNNKHIHKYKTCKKPISSLSPSNDTLQFQNKCVLNKCKPNDSVNINSCCKTKINSQFV